jgi:hypothetical protein
MTAAARRFCSMIWSVSATKSADSELPSWEKVKAKFQKGGILIGNGASLAVWKNFGYRSLYEKAESHVEHPLSSEDKHIFKSLQTENFEQVLGALSTAMSVTKILHRDASFIQDRYKNIQRALVEAVRAVHVPWIHVPKATLVQIRKAILDFDFVFSTNYDLLLYWAIMAATPTKFKDYFWGEEFDSANTEVSSGTKVLYLHGGLHLYRDSSGKSIKRTAKPNQNLLDLFGKPFKGRATPLFITEGSSENKLRSIRRSDYLSFAYEQFSQHKGPMVVFGHSLGNTDSHLIHAMMKWGSRDIAISLRVNDAADIDVRKAALKKRLRHAKLEFFDAETHPLGGTELQLHSN